MTTTYRPLGVENIEIAYSSPTFTVQGSGGRALSSSNPGLVTFNKADGAITVPVTANQDFIDDSGASEIVNNLFGFTTSIAITVDVPFFLYAVLNDDEDAVAFMISREAGRLVSPVAASIGAPDDAVADDQESFWSLENIDETVYASNPCMLIGSFRMRMSASDDWTVQALNNGNDGIGKYQEETTFTMPLGQIGADSGQLTVPNGGTSAVFTTKNGKYRLTPDGYCYYQVSMSGDGGGDGSGAVNALCVAPFKNINQTTVFTLASGRVQYAGGTVNMASIDNNGANASFRIADYNAALTYLQWPAFSNGARRFEFQVYYNYLN